MAEQKKKDWEKQTIEKIAMESLIQQKISRRWSIFFKLVGLIYLGWVLIFVLTSSNKSTIATGDFTALITLSGEIGVDSEISAFNNLSLSMIAKHLVEFPNPNPLIKKI